MARTTKVTKKALFWVVLLALEEIEKPIGSAGSTRPEMQDRTRGPEDTQSRKSLYFVWGREITGGAEWPLAVCPEREIGSPEGKNERGL